MRTDYGRRYRGCLTVQSTFLEGKCAMFGIFSQLRLAMDTETYPHDFTTALIPFPVPSEDYAEFYTQESGKLLRRLYMYFRKHPL